MMPDPIRCLALILAVVGVVLNNYRHRGCFLCWLGSNGIWMYVDYDAGIYEQALQHLVFLLLAVHGLWCWRKVR